MSCCCCPLTAPAPAPQAHPPPGAIPVIPKSSHLLLPSTPEASAESPPTPLVCGWPGEIQRWFLECHQPPTAPQGDLGVCILPLSTLPSPQHCCSALSWMQLSLIHSDSSPQGSDYSSPWSRAHIKLYLCKYQAGREPQEAPQAGRQRGFPARSPTGAGSSFLAFPQLSLRLHKRSPGAGRCRGAEVSCRGFPRAPAEVTLCHCCRRHKWKAGE